jgi:hypothetical protein
LNSRESGTSLAPQLAIETAQLPPANTVLPSVSGSMVSGQLLSASAGSWSGSLPISFAYQWLRCDAAGAGCVNVGGGLSTYLLGDGDVGSTVRVAVTGSNSAGQATATSAATAPVVAAGCAPRSSSYSSAILGTAGLLGYWRLGEASGTVACDSTGRNNGGYQLGTTLARPGALYGDVDTAVGFDGISGWVQVPHSSTFNVGDRFTVEAWVKRGTVSSASNQVVAAKQSGSFVLLINSANHLVLRKSGVADVAESAATIADTSKWHQVAATKDGAAVHLYLDGADVTNGFVNQTMTDNTLPLAVGQSSGSAYFNGLIDEVAIYSMALTSSQLAGHYNVGAPPQGPVNTAPPSISGSAVSGQTLSASAGSWSGTQPISFAYQWQRCMDGGTVCATVASQVGSSYTLSALDVGATIRINVTASNSDGSTAVASAPTGVVAPPPAPPGDPVIAAAGDIACDPLVLAASPDTSTSCNEQQTSDLLVNLGLVAVLALGDNQYACGGYTAFMQSYDPTWGRLKALTHPVPGNHEYQTQGGTDCDASGHANGYFQYFGASAGQASQGYYSYDVGAWHLIALNSNCSAVGGCGQGSPQETWLRADLAAHPASCTLAYWHHPRFTSGSVGEDSEVAPIWQDLYAAGADVVLNGHAHGYERFAPQDPSQAYDPAAGLREFVVGTGGEDFQPFSTFKPLSERHDDVTFGVLTLRLHTGSYDWQFLPAAGGSFSDSGSASCH